MWRRPFKLQNFSLVAALHWAAISTLYHKFSHFKTAKTSSCCSQSQSTAKLTSEHFLKAQHQLYLMLCPNTPRVYRWGCIHPNTFQRCCLGSCGCCRFVPLARLVPRSCYCRCEVHVKAASDQRQALAGTGAISVSGLRWGWRRGKRNPHATVASSLKNFTLISVLCAHFFLDGRA